MINLSTTPDELFQEFTKGVEISGDEADSRLVSTIFPAGGERESASMTIFRASARGVISTWRRAVLQHAVGTAHKIRSNMERIETANKQLSTGLEIERAQVVHLQGEVARATEGRGAYVAVELEKATKALEKDRQTIIDLRALVETLTETRERALKSLGLELEAARAKPPGIQAAPVLALLKETEQRFLDKYGTKPPVYHEFAWRPVAEAIKLLQDATPPAQT